MNDELERLRREALVPCFKIISPHVPGGTEDNYENTSVSITDFRVDILTGDLPNTNQDC